MDGRLLPVSSLAGATALSPSSPEQERVGVEGKVDRRGDTGLGGVGESLCLLASPSPSVTWGSIIRLAGRSEAQKGWCSCADMAASRSLWQ